ncbi:MAG TPA: threonine-phosphate decarboxylase CobD [Xanthobacteraceae bacterium]
MRATVIGPPAAFARLAHGGDLSAARSLFPGAAEPFIDLSTGINPEPYPIPALDPELFQRLPQADTLRELCAAAAQAYAAPSPDHVVAAPGAQMLLPAVASLLPPGRAAILRPTYSEYARVARVAGHRVAEAGDVGSLASADLALVANPNNPDGRRSGKRELMELAEALRGRGGLLVIDESFMDAAPDAATLAGEVDRGAIVVLRSLGKFFGLAGLRLGFAVSAPELAARIAAWLGPWAVSGPAIAIGRAALGDRAWAEATRQALAGSARRLDSLLADAGLSVIGGTALFRLVRTDAAAELFERLGRAGILVRRFEEEPSWLRFGLPGPEDAWRRLEAALAGLAT